MALDISDHTQFQWAECSIVENRKIYVRDTIGLKRKKRNSGLHRYDLELVTVEMDLGIARKAKARLSRAADLNEPLLYVHPRCSFAQGVEPVEGITVFVDKLPGENLITLTSVGFWQLLAGDHITFSNDTKVYEVAEDTLLTSGPQAVLLTFPLRKQINVFSNVTVNNIVFELLSDSVIEIQTIAADNQDVTLTLNAVENI